MDREMLNTNASVAQWLLARSMSVDVSRSNPIVAFFQNSARGEPSLERKKEMGRTTKRRVKWAGPLTKINGRAGTTTRNKLEIAAAKVRGSSGSGK